MSGETLIALGSIFAILALGVLGAVLLHLRQNRPKPQREPR